MSEDSEVKIISVERAFEQYDYFLKYIDFMEALVRQCNVDRDYVFSFDFRHSIEAVKKHVLPIEKYAQNVSGLEEIMEEYQERKLVREREGYRTMAIDLFHELTILDRRKLSKLLKRNNLFRILERVTPEKFEMIIADFNLGELKWISKELDLCKFRIENEKKKKHK